MRISRVIQIYRLQSRQQFRSYMCYLIPADRSGFGHFTKKKVRKAVLHAIDRNALVKALVPSQLHGQPLQRAICHDWHVGCVSSIPPTRHNLSKS